MFDTLLEGGKISRSQVVGPETSLSVDECLQKYETDLRTLFHTHGNDKQSADIMILGMGPDGHIASLFPPLSRALLPSTTEKERIYHTQTPRFDVFDRMTVSLAQIQATSEKIFFLQGSGKADLWHQMLQDYQDCGDNVESVARLFPAVAVIDSGNTVAVTGF